MQARGACSRASRTPCCPARRSSVSARLRWSSSSSPIRFRFAKKRRSSARFTCCPSRTWLVRRSGARTTKNRSARCSIPDFGEAFMEIVALNVRKRTGLGKGESGRIRARGGIPGIFYGPRQESAIPIEVESREFAKKVDVLEGSHLIQLDSDAAELKQKMVLLREVQRHPVTHRVLHTDFYEVDLTKKLEVTVPLHFVGKAVGTV